jgi:hypothetical protein
MEFLEEPQVTDRNIVLDDATKRTDARSRLSANFAAAKTSLSPRNQLSRLAERNKTKAKDVLEEAATVARKGAPVVGAIGLGVLLFAVRRPISKWISRLKRPTSSTDN